MKHIMIPALIGAASLVGVSSLVATASAAPRPTITAGATDALPEIWKNVPANQRLQYVRAAELDATRVLAERIMGTMLDSETSIRDLAAADDSVKGSVTAFIKGIKTTEAPTFCDDGRVEVVRAVDISKLIQDLTTKMNGSGKTISTDRTLRKEVETIDALGNAAIPGSLGQKRVLAKRAAEMDVYRRLAERVAGVAISGDSTVKDFALQDDAIRAKMTDSLKGAEMTAINYGDDATATVTAKLKVGPLVHVIVRKIEASGKKVVLDDKTKQLIIEETGSGAYVDASQNAAADTEQGKPASTEVDVIVSSVLD